MSTDPYSFREQLARSKARRQDSDIDTLRLMFPRSARVSKTTAAEDRAGVDYHIILRRGARLLVDAKSREQGCARWWNGSPELALEIWSVKPGGLYRTPPAQQKTGWTLDESSDVDLILFTFDGADHEYAYVRSLPLLREVFRRHAREWQARYKTDIQCSRYGNLRWQSECVFVPLPVVDDAIRQVSRSCRNSIARAEPTPCIVAPAGPALAG